MIRKLGVEPNLDIRRLIDIVGLKQAIDQIGADRVINELGLKEIIDRAPLEDVLAALDFSKLTPQQLQDLKRRLP